MAAVQELCRTRWTVSRNDDIARVSTAQTSDARRLLWTRNAQRGCVSQTIRADGKDWRNAATAGKAWMTSPSEPSRTTRKRGSGMRRLAHGIEEVARRMILGVADDSYADTEARRRRPLRDGRGGVIRSLGMNVRPQVLQKGFHIRLAEEENIVDSSQRADQRGTGRFGQDRSTGAFQGADARI